jgi:hypothetical protein
VKSRRRRIGGEDVYRSTKRISCAWSITAVVVVAFSGRYISTFNRGQYGGPHNDELVQMRP